MPAQNFAGKDGYTCYDMTTADYRGILFNFNNPYWTENRDIIPAVCYAIDRQAIVDSVLLGQGMAAHSPLQRNVYNDETVNHYDYDPAKAKEILESVGCTMGDSGYYERNGEEIGFVISVMSGEQDRIDIAQAAAQQLREVGIHCTVDIPAQMDWSGQMACLIGWGSPFDADDHTYKVFGTDKGANYSGYSNALVDEYLTRARAATTPSAKSITANSCTRSRTIRPTPLSATSTRTMSPNPPSTASMRTRCLGITASAFSGTFRTGRSASKRR